MKRCPVCRETLFNGWSCERCSWEMTIAKGEAWEADQDRKEEARRRREWKMEGEKRIEKAKAESEFWWAEDGKQPDSYMERWEKIWSQKRGCYRL